MPAKGRGSPICIAAPLLRRFSRAKRGGEAMNEHAQIKTPAAPTSVTTGPIAGSRKVYASPKGHADINVPFREITLTGAGEAPVRVYDASGPYTESDVRVDLAAGVAPVRESWIAKRGYG